MSKYNSNKKKKKKKIHIIFMMIITIILIQTLFYTLPFALPSRPLSISSIPYESKAISSLKKIDSKRNSFVFKLTSRRLLPELTMILTNTDKNWSESSVG